MSAPPKNKSTVCHVTDAGGVVHLAMVRRSMNREGKVLAFNVATACAPKVKAWNAKLDSDEMQRDLPEGFDLPKKLAECGLLVKYEPESLIAPPITCVSCAALSPVAKDLWRNQ